RTRCPIFQPPTAWPGAKLNVNSGLTGVSLCCSSRCQRSRVQRLREGGRLTMDIRRVDARVELGDLRIALASRPGRLAAPEHYVHRVAVEVANRAVGDAVVHVLRAGGAGQPRAPARPGQAAQVVVAVGAGQRVVAGPDVGVTLA